MADVFQRLLIRPEPEALSLNAQAALGPVRAPERSQFAHLWRHFIERFFNHETASPGGDARSRVFLIAAVTALPPLVMSIYLWPVYHPWVGWPPGTHNSGPPPYWLQVNHHFFFVVYSFVALGIATVFEWDLFFPDLLDLLVLGTLPIASARLFLSRVTAIAIFLGGFLLAADVPAPLVLPEATDPPNLGRFVLGHLLAVLAAGLFAAALILALQGLLLSIVGERLFRKGSLLVQGVAIALLVLCVLLFPVFSGVTPVLLQSGNLFTRCFPPFWFLGIYQRVLEGPGALPVYTQLAQIGIVATLAAMAIAAFAYPIAYLRKVRDLVEGPATRSARVRISRPLHHVFHLAVVRAPIGRAVFHFISQTIFRVPRYRIYLVLYGGVGLSVVTASLLRFSTVHGRVLPAISADGIRVIAGIVPFWIIAGLRTAFASSGNRRGSWIFFFTHGRPAHIAALVDQLVAAKKWVLIASTAITFALIAALIPIAPPELNTPLAIVAQLLTAAAMCLLLTDIFFLGVTLIPFTGEPAAGEPSLALTCMKFYFFFPVVVAIPVVWQLWLTRGGFRYVLFVALVAVIHIGLRYRFLQKLREHSNMPALEEDEEDFPMKLGLRY